MKQKLLITLLSVFLELFNLALPQVSLAASAGGGSTATDTPAASSSTTSGSGNGSSNCVFTIIGNLPAGLTPTMPTGCNFGISATGNEVVDHANELVAAAQKNCSGEAYAWGGGDVGHMQGIVSNDGSNCLDNAIPSFGWEHPSDAIGQIQYYGDDGAPALYYQCVGFVETVISGINGAGFSGLNTAADYINSSPGFGYQYVDKNSPGAKLEPGDIVLYFANVSGITGSAGHIAIATTIAGDKFTVAEANFLYAGYVNNTRLDNNEDPAFAGWLHKQ